MASPIPSPLPARKSFTLAARRPSAPAAATTGAQISGGIQFDYGLASGVTIFAGSQIVDSGGVASNTTVSGGIQRVGDQFGSGTAVSTTIDSTGQQYVGSEGSGAASSTTINDGGVQWVGFFGGSGFATDTTIDSGGTQYVGYWNATGTASGTTISGGAEISVCRRQRHCDRDHDRQRRHAISARPDGGIGHPVRLRQRAASRPRDRRWSSPAASPAAHRVERRHRDVSSGGTDRHPHRGEQDVSLRQRRTSSRSAIRTSSGGTAVGSTVVAVAATSPLAGRRAVRRSAVACRSSTPAERRSGRRSSTRPSRMSSPAGRRSARRSAAGASRKSTGS